MKMTISPIEFQLCRHDTFHFNQGRNLAKEVYFDTWKTEAMSNNYDYGVVAMSDGKAVGNINIQFRDTRNQLSSEKFFRPQHWLEFGHYQDQEIAELCGLSIHSSVRRFFRAYILGGLILGSHLVALQKGVTAFATVQRNELINKLITHYNYPFIRSNESTVNLKNIPKDNYWQNSVLPELYFIDLLDSQTIGASFMLLKQLAEQGIVVKNDTNDKGLKLGRKLSENVKNVA